MFGSQVLDVVVGLVFVYLLLSIICTAANEMIAALFSLRGRNLVEGISNLLADNQVKGLAGLFYDHPLIKGLYRGKTKPSYISAHTFTLAFLDGIAPAKGDVTAVMSEIKTAVNGLPNDSELRQVLLILLQQAGDDFTKFRAGIEVWFNDAMDRVSGWYKRKSQLIILVLAVFITGFTNADTIQIVKSLFSDPVIRAAVAARAQEFVKQPAGTIGRESGKKSEPTAGSAPGEAGGSAPAPKQPATTQNSKETMTQALENLQQLGIPLGWQVLPQRDEWQNKIIGLLLTVFALSLGAPFWFDILNRVTKIRSTGAVPEAAAKGKKKENPV